MFWKLYIRKENGHYKVTIFVSETEYGTFQNTGFIVLDSQNEVDSLITNFKECEVVIAE